MLVISPFRTMQAIRKLLDQLSAVVLISVRLCLFRLEFHFETLLIKLYNSRFCEKAVNLVILASKGIQKSYFRLPQILAALQSHSRSSGSTARALAETWFQARLPLPLLASFPPLSFPSGSSAGIVVVPSFISTYCTLGNSAFTTKAIVGAPSLLDACVYMCV